MDCNALLQGIFLTPCLFHLLHWQVGSLPLAPPGSLGISYTNGTDEPICRAETDADVENGCVNGRVDQGRMN